MPPEFRAMRCPDCKREMRPAGKGRYECDTPGCPVIWVWPEWGYMGSDRVARDAAMSSARNREIAKVTKT